MGIRVFTAAVGTEVNTFSPIALGLSSFKSNTWFPPGEHPATATFLSWPRQVAVRRAERDDLVVLEGLTAMADQGGPISRSVHEQLRDQVLRELASSLPVDIVLLGLHGGMIAEGYEDCEGDLLARVRQIVGPDVVIGAQLDLHGHLSAAMAAHANVLVGLKTFPHTDMQARAEELLSICLRAQRGEALPVMSIFDCRMLGVHFTERAPMSELMHQVAELERQEQVLSITIMHSSPWADVPDAGAKVLVVTNNAPRVGERVAREIGLGLRKIRGRTTPAFSSLDQARDRIERPRPATGPVVLADVADNPNGGAPGDSTFLLQLLRDQPTCRSAFGPLWDPIAVGQCLDAGEGASLRLRIGGKMGPSSGAPLDVSAKVVKIIHDFHQQGEAFSAEMGDCALIQVEQVLAVLVSRRYQGFTPQLFTAFDLDPATLDCIVVKSTGLFRREFEAVAGEILYVDSPGCLTFDPRLLSYQRIRRPMWPLDPVSDEAGGAE
jgi:microcystin degradation protein MlrC